MENYKMSIKGEDRGLTGMFYMAPLRFGGPSLYYRISVFIQLFVNHTSILMYHYYV
jgi:hypothetical protein